MNMKRFSKTYFISIKLEIKQKDDTVKNNENKSKWILAEQEIINFVTKEQYPGGLSLMPTYVRRTHSLFILTSQAPSHTDQKCKLPHYTCLNVTFSSERRASSQLFLVWMEVSQIKGTVFYVNCLFIHLSCIPWIMFPFEEFSQRGFLMLLNIKCTDIVTRLMTLPINNLWPFTYNKTSKPLLSF